MLAITNPIAPNNVDELVPLLLQPASASGPSEVLSFVMPPSPGVVPDGAGALGSPGITPSLGRGAPESRKPPLKGGVGIPGLGAHFSIFGDPFISRLYIPLSSIAYA